MKIKLKCFADLAYKHECRHDSFTSIDLDDGNTVFKVLDTSGIAENDVKIIFVNGKVSGLGHSLSDGDHVTLVPATGGM